jgi:hypothetical protein
MPFTFDEMTKAVEEYPANDVDLEIVDLALPGGALNADASGTFKVRVVNRGPLNLTGVRVHVYAQNGATVCPGTHAAEFVSDFVSDEFEMVKGHGGSVLSPGRPFRFKPPHSASRVARTLIRITLDSWNANLDHILIGHTDPRPEPKATYAAVIAPS